MTYACPIRHTAAKSNISKLKITQSGHQGGSPVNPEYIQEKKVLVGHLSVELLVSRK